MTLDFDPMDLRRQTFKEQKKVSFEEDAVRDLLMALKYPKQMKDQVYEYAKSFDRRRPQMVDFRECFDSFPVAMFAYRPQNLQGTAGLSKLFPLSAMLKQDFFKEIYTIEKEQEFVVAGRPIALVIPWPRLKQPAVLHQLPYNDQLDGVRVIVSHEHTAGERRRCTLEPLKQFASLVSYYEE